MQPIFHTLPPPLFINVCNDMQGSLAQNTELSYKRFNTLHNIHYFIRCRTFKHLSLVLPFDDPRMEVCRHEACNPEAWQDWPGTHSKYQAYEYRGI